MKIRFASPSSWFLAVIPLLCLCSSPQGYAQTQKTPSETKQGQQQKADAKTAKNAKDNLQEVNQVQAETKENETKNNQEATTKIDWGDWDLTPAGKFGVGIEGDIEAQLSLLDKSNLLENATGVATTEKADNTVQSKKPNTKDLKQMMAELEAMEAKVKKEIEDDTEF